MTFLKSHPAAGAQKAPAAGAFVRKGGQAHTGPAPLCIGEKTQKGVYCLQCAPARGGAALSGLTLTAGFENARLKALHRGGRGPAGRTGFAGGRRLLRLF